MRTRRTGNGKTARADTPAEFRVPVAEPLQPAPVRAGHGVRLARLVGTVAATRNDFYHYGGLAAGSCNCRISRPCSDRSARRHPTYVFACMKSRPNSRATSMNLSVSADLSSKRRETPQSM